MDRRWHNVRFGFDAVNVCISNPVTKYSIPFSGKSFSFWYSEHLSYLAIKQYFNRSLVESFSNIYVTVQPFAIIKHFCSKFWIKTHSEYRTEFKSHGHVLILRYDRPDVHFSNKCQMWYDYLKESHKKRLLTNREIVLQSNLF